MLVREVPGHPHGMTFGNIKFHLPIGLPLGKAVQVILRKASTGEISELHSFNTLALRPSGPDVLCIFRLFNSFNCDFTHGVNGAVPFEGISVSDSRVNSWKLTRIVYCRY